MMSRYNKAWVAVLGVLAQVAVAAAEALDKGLIPPSWAPWARVLLAVATALGVYGVPNAAASSRIWGLTGDGRHELGRDRGRAGVLLLVVVLAVAGLLAASAGPAAAHWRDQQVVAPRVAAVSVCGGVMVVRFDVARLDRRQWVQLLDDESTRLELLEVSGRSGPDGLWSEPPADGGRVVSGGENVLRWPGWTWATQHGQHYALARVVTGGYGSVPSLIEEGCAA